MVRVVTVVLLTVSVTVVGLLSACAPASVLEVSRLDTREALLRAPVQPGEEFIISFTHSVNRRPVHDTLRAETDHMTIVSSRFDAFGAGMPETSTAEGTLTVAEDGWLLWTVNRPVPEVVVRVGRVADHILTLKGHDIHLADLAPPGTALTFQVRRATMIERMKGRYLP